MSYSITSPYNPNKVIERFDAESEEAAIEIVTERARNDEVSLALYAESFRLGLATVLAGETYWTPSAGERR